MRMHVPIGVMNVGKLTDKQERFCQEYLIDLNATKAAERAEYSPKTANEQGARLLANVSVAERISELQAERAKRTNVDADRVIEQLAKIAFSDITQFVDWSNNAMDIKPSDQVDGTVLSAIVVHRYKGDFKREVKLQDKMKALELLGKHLGMFKDKVEVGGPDGEPITVIFPTMPRPAKAGAPNE